jgi:hypothetical protein
MQSGKSRREGSCRGARGPTGIPVTLQAIPHDIPAAWWAASARPCRARIRRSRIRNLDRSNHAHLSRQFTFPVPDYAEWDGRYRRHGAI